MEQLSDDLWKLAVEEFFVHGIRHLFWLLLLAVSVMIFGRKWRSLNNRLAVLESEEKASPPINLRVAPPVVNITNIVNGNPKRARLTGKFYLGSMFHPNLLEETMYPTVLVPEILIEQEDGTQEVLEIGGYKVVDDLGQEVRNDIEITEGFMFHLGRPDEPARIGASFVEEEKRIAEKRDDD